MIIYKISNIQKQANAVSSTLHIDRILNTQLSIDFMEHLSYYFLTSCVYVCVCVCACVCVYKKYLHLF